MRFPVVNAASHLTIPQPAGESNGSAKGVMENDLALLREELAPGQQKCRHHEDSGICFQATGSKAFVNESFAALFCENLSQLINDA